MPVPIVGLLAASVKFGTRQWLWSGPAAAGVGLAFVVNTTVEEEGGHVPFAIVHCRVAVLPASTITLVVALAGVTIVAVPATTVHNPVPIAGTFAAIVYRESEQCVCAGPATDGVGVAKFVNTTSSVVLHVPFVMVHLRVAVAPVATVTAVVALVGVVIVAAPETIVHNPEPVAGVLAAMINAGVAQLLRSGPAAAKIFLLFVSTTSSVNTQVPLVIVHLRVAVLPANTNTVLVALAGVVMVAVPETIVHNPVPTLAGVAAIVNSESEQCV
jgi:hypothetical protein